MKEPGICYWGDESSAYAISQATSTGVLVVDVDCTGTPFTVLAWPDDPLRRREHGDMLKVPASELANIVVLYFTNGNHYDLIAHEGDSVWTADTFPAQWIELWAHVLGQHVFATGTSAAAAAADDHSVASAARSDTEASAPSTPAGVDFDDARSTSSASPLAAAGDGYSDRYDAYASSSAAGDGYSDRAYASSAAGDVHAPYALSAAAGDGYRYNASATSAHVSSAAGGDDSEEASATSAPAGGDEEASATSPAGGDEEASATSAEYDASATLAAVDVYSASGASAPAKRFSQRAFAKALQAKHAARLQELLQAEQAQRPPWASTAAPISRRADVQQIS